MGGLGILLTRAKDIYRTDGLALLLARGFDFARRRFFHYGKYYLYEHTLEERNEADFMPVVGDFTFRIVGSNEEADELAAATGYDFRRRFVIARKRLDRGAIAFCVFVNGEVAHIGWVALCEKARKAVDSLPYNVDFSNNEGCTGGTETVPEYRGKRLMVYGYFKRSQFLREKGMTVSRNAVAVSNIPSQKAHAKFAPRIYAQASYLKLLAWEFWREIPLTQTGHRD